MTIRIQREGLAMPVSKSLCNLFISVLPLEQIKQSTNAITINFRDPCYSAEKGGYHPVEVRLERITVGSSVEPDTFKICYITDFCYAGYEPFAELVKDIDFDFSCGVTQMQNMKPFPIEQSAELFGIWEQNFIHYAKDLRVFKTEVQLATH